MYDHESLVKLWDGREKEFKEKPIAVTSLLYGEDREAIILNRMKYIYSYSSEIEELYDLENDLSEKINLIETSSEIADKAIKSLKVLKNETERDRIEIGIKKKTFKIDKELTEKLKALGYFN